ncbi:hypothetical protein BVI2075_820003 [Burkholderia vietnamiensis]|nr:hypothetical protein BVI2075_820003 [Burkholderia vietnamiensis]
MRDGGLHEPRRGYPQDLREHGAPLHARRVVHGRYAARRAVRAFGRRQEHDAAGDRRLARARRRHDHAERRSAVRRRARHRRADPRAPRRLSVPGLRAVPASECTSEHRVRAHRRAAQPARERGAAGSRVLAARVRARRASRAVSGAAVGRAETARRARARAGLAAAHPAARRAVRRARPHDASAHASRAGRATGAARYPDGADFARSRRRRRLRRSGRATQRRARAGRDAARGVAIARDVSMPTHERARRGVRATGVAAAACGGMLRTRERSAHVLVSGAAAIARSVCNAAGDRAPPGVEARRADTVARNHGSERAAAITLSPSPPELRSMP